MDRLKGNTIGMELRLMRTERNLSMKEVADVIGISENYMSNIERDKKTPSDLLIRKIANFYDIEEKYLFDRYGRIPLAIAEEIKDNELLNDVLYEISMNKKLSADQKERLYKDIQNLYLGLEKENL